MCRRPSSPLDLLVEPEVWQQEDANNQEWIDLDMDFDFNFDLDLAFSALEVLPSSLSQLLLVTFNAGIWVMEAFTLSALA